MAWGSSCVVLAAPAGCYLAAEFAARPQWLDGFLWATPVTCGWRLVGWAGGSPAAPWWAWALWPTVGLAAALARTLVRPRP